MRITARSNKYYMEGIPLALVAERSPMLELLVIGNLECIKREIVHSCTILTLWKNSYWIIEWKLCKLNDHSNFMKNYSKNNNPHRWLINLTDSYIKDLISDKLRLRQKIDLRLFMLDRRMFFIQIHAEMNALQLSYWYYYRRTCRIYYYYYSYGWDPEGPLMLGYPRCIAN